MYSLIIQMAENNLILYWIMKNNLNKDMYWQFEGTNNFDGTPLKWNFTKSYQLLMYYRVV